MVLYNELKLKLVFLFSELIEIAFYKSHLV